MPHRRQAAAGFSQETWPLSAETVADRNVVELVDDRFDRLARKNTLDLNRRPGYRERDLPLPADDAGGTFASFHHCDFSHDHLIHRGCLARDARPLRRNRYSGKVGYLNQVHPAPRHPYRSDWTPQHQVTSLACAPLSIRRIRELNWSAPQTAAGWRSRTWRPSVPMARAAERGRFGRGVDRCLRLCYARSGHSGPFPLNSPGPAANPGSRTEPL